MPSASGSFIGKTNSQAMVCVKDAPDHEMSVIEVTGPQTSSDPLWIGATVSYWGVADLVAGNGTRPAISLTGTRTATSTAAPSPAGSRPQAMP